MTSNSNLKDKEGNFKKLNDVYYRGLEDDRSRINKTKSNNNPLKNINSNLDKIDSDLDKEYHNNLLNRKRLFNKNNNDENSKNNNISYINHQTNKFIAKGNINL